MPPAPRACLVTQNPACLTSHGQTVDSPVICVVAILRVVLESSAVRQLSRLLVLRGRGSLNCIVVYCPPLLRRAFVLSLSLPPPRSRFRGRDEV